VDFGQLARFEIPNKIIEEYT